MGQQFANFEANSIQRRRATYDRFILTTFLCTLQATTSANDADTQPATLDTGPVASSNPAGVRTRSSTRPYQSARPTLGSPQLQFRVR